MGGVLTKRDDTQRNSEELWEPWELSPLCHFATLPLIYSTHLNIDLNTHRQVGEPPKPVGDDLRRRVIT